MLEEKIVGKIKWFNPIKNFGFIEVEGQEKDSFLHISAVNDSGINPEDLKDGTEVEFELKEDEKTGKISAANIVIIK